MDFIFGANRVIQFMNLNLLLAVFGNFLNGKFKIKEISDGKNDGDQLVKKYDNLIMKTSILNDRRFHDEDQLVKTKHDDLIV